MSKVADEFFDKKLKWGDKIIVSEIGMWGQKCNQAEYTFSGSKGKFPNVMYRFTRIGDSSVHDKKYMDVEFWNESCYVGYRNGIYEIDDINKLASSE